MDYRISILEDPGRIPELIELFRTGLGDTSADHWRWRLFTDVGQPEQPFAVIAEDEAGKLVGVSTFFPVRYGCSGTKAVEFGDWIVHPSCRGQGLIGKIFGSTCSWFSDQGYAFIMTSFPNQNSGPILRRFGFTDLPNVAEYVTSNRLFFSGKAPADRVVEGVQFRFTDACPLTEAPQHREGRLQRSLAFLRWKFDQNPDASYRWLSLWQQERCIGYFVYHRNKGRIRTAVNIHDWELEPGSEPLFSEAIRLLAKRGSFVSIWGKYPEQTLSMFHAAGMHHSGRSTPTITKPFYPGGVPDDLTLTRADTDY